MKNTITEALEVGETISITLEYFNLGLCVNGWRKTIKRKLFKKCTNGLQIFTADRLCIGYWNISLKFI